MNLRKSLMRSQNLKSGIRGELLTSWGSHDHHSFDGGETKQEDQEEAEIHCNVSSEQQLAGVVCVLAPVTLPSFIVQIKVKHPT